MSDAEQPDRERLDWGDETPEPVSTNEPAGEQPTDPADDRQLGDAEPAPVDDDPKAELCSVEDPTCDACQ